MKKLIILFLLTAMAEFVQAQKSYVTVIFRHDESVVNLSGDLPEGIDAYYYCSTSNGTRYYSIGDILNMLSSHGYEVEQMATQPLSTNNKFGIVYLLSKQKEPNKPNEIKRITDDTKEVKEVARFNLQGMPVSKTEKGIQIIVFSNYTTKTVIVE